MTRKDPNAPLVGSKKLRVGIVLIGGASEGGGGTGRRFARLFQHIQQRGSSADVTLITGPKFLDLIDRSSIEIDRTRNVILFEDRPGAGSGGTLSNFAGYKESSDRLAALAREAELDLVHIPIPDLVYAPFLIRKPDGIRQVFSMTAAIGAFDSLNWKAKLLYRLGFEYSDAIDTLYSDVAGRFPSFADKIRVSPCSFTDYSRYQPADEKKKQIVFAGRLEAFKNPELFVAGVGLAADALRANGWKCLLFGGGELEAQVTSAIEDRRLSDLIEMDLAPDLSPILARSMVFASLQQTENYPSQVLLEAMACANAVIATDVGDTRKLVDEEVGVLIGEQTPEALAGALTRLATDMQLCERLAAKARDRILDEHTVARFAEYIDAFWAEASATQNPAPAPTWARLATMFTQSALGMRFS